MTTKASQQQEVRWAWRSGSHFTIKAEVVACCLEDIRRKLRRDPEASDIVAEAAAKKSPLHGLIFNCDDTDAVQAYREQRARVVMNSLRSYVINVETKQEVEQIPFVNVRYTEETEDGENIRHSVYMPTAKAMEVPEYQDYVIEDALRYAKGFARRVKQLKEFKEVCEAIERVEARYAAEKQARKEVKEKDLVSVGK